MPRKRFDPGKHHDIKHYKRLRRELVTMRNGIIQSFKDVSNRTYHSANLKKTREVVMKDMALLNHIDAVVRATCDFLADGGFELPPVPHVRIKELVVIDETGPDGTKIQRYDSEIGKEEIITYK